VNCYRLIAVPTIFIADDSEPILRVLRTFFARHSQFRIVGEAQNYVDTVISVAELKPDVVLADVRMPGAISGAAGLSQVVAACGCPVIAMSFTTDAELQSLITNAGAARLLDKTRLYQDLVPAIDEVLTRK
jgi:DNA-binding NarL/FixJ family response regulator